MSSTASTTPAKDETVTTADAVADSTTKTDSVLRYVKRAAREGRPKFLFRTWSTGL
jgi:hypothetical protein